MSDFSNQQLLRLSFLLLLEQRLRDAVRDELPFIIVNETSKIIRYNQAVLWQPRYSARKQIRAVSGVSVPDPYSPFFQSLKAMLPLIQRHLNRKIKPSGKVEEDPETVNSEILTFGQFSDDIQKKWVEWFPENALWCPLKGPSGDIPGFLVMFRDEPFSEPDQKIMSHLSSAFGHAVAYEKIKYVPINSIRRKIKRFLFASVFLLLLSVLFCFPIRQFSMASSEIVPVNPTLVRAPLDGVIRMFYQVPDAVIKKGDPILELDDAKLKSHLDIAEKKLQIVKVQLLQSQQMAFTDPKAKAMIDVFNEMIKQEQAEVDYVKTLLKRTVVYAAHDGILIFDDPDEWLGRPVAIGEKIMLLANPDDIELKISMPVTESIELHDGGDVDFFLNIAPTRPLKALVRSINYSTHITPDNVVAYGISASFTEKSSIARIGLRGTARLFGPDTRLGVWALRKPINTIQQWLNL